MRVVIVSSIIGSSPSYICSLWCVVLARSNITAHLFSHSFLFSKCFILARVKVEPEHMPGTRQDHTLDEPLGHHVAHIKLEAILSY